MRTVSILSTVIAGSLFLGLGCQRSEAPRDLGRDSQQQAAPAATPAEAAAPEQPARRASFTAKKNPTAKAGRGEPSLDDSSRPAAWIYIDRLAGKYVEREGVPQVQWFIDGTVSASPTFRVEVFEPLLGTPTDFACTLDTRESADGSTVAYGIKANDGTFQVGREYSLVSPGENFTVRNRLTGDVVSEIGSLMPGTYVIVAGIKDLQTGTEGLAVTEFTVGGE